MRRLGTIFLLLCVFSYGALASNDFRGVGNWADPNIWSAERVPSGEEEVKVRGEDTICTLNTSTGDWGVGRRMRVYEGATLIIEEGAELLGAGWMRVGASNPGYVEQTGGLVQLQDGRDDAKLGIGDQGDSDGNYTISGGTLTYAENSAGDLIVGARAGKGKLTIIGTGPTILMNNLIVGDRAGASGTIEFQIDADGVSPIVLAGSASIDPEGDETTANLLISAIAAPPMSNITLVDIPEGAEAPNVFDTVNGIPAEDGATVLLTSGGIGYYYHLSYSRGATNDIVLVFDYSVGLIPVSLGAVGDITVCNDERYGPDQSNNGSGLEARNIPERRNVTIISYDISGIPLLEGDLFSNMSFSHFSHDQHGEVNVYGIIEDLDLLDVESLTWNIAPGVQNDPTPELGAPVALDYADLTDVLLTFTGPGETGVRFSTDTSDALADFINSDTDGIVTFLFAASAEDTQLIVRSREHSAGGSLLEGQIIPTRPASVDPGNDGLVAYYALDGDAADGSGNGLDGTVMGDPNFITDDAGTYLQLDGIDDYVDMGNDPNFFDITEQITLSAWVKPNDIGNEQDNPWIGKGDKSYALKGFRRGYTIEFYIYDSTWVTVHADVDPSFNGQWHQAAGTFDGKALKLYINGNLASITEYEGSIALSTSNVNIGKNSDKSDRFYEGAIDEVLIYNRALSAGEVAHLAGL